MTNTPGTTSQAPTVAGIIADARAATVGVPFLPQGTTVDVLLDCLNAAVRPSVKRVILDSLADFGHRNMSPTGEFIECLDRIQVALQVDAAFDDLALDGTASEGTASEGTAIKRIESEPV
jgi:hypothetical protein